MDRRLRFAQIPQTASDFARFAPLEPDGQHGRGHDIFEGTEQIQQLVISRAISGLRIE